MVMIGRRMSPGQIVNHATIHSKQTKYVPGFFNDAQPFPKYAGNQGELERNDGAASPGTLNQKSNCRVEGSREGRAWMSRFFLSK